MIGQEGWLMRISLLEFYLFPLLLLKVKSKALITKELLVLKTPMNIEVIPLFTQSIFTLNYRTCKILFPSNFFPTNLIFFPHLGLYFESSQISKANFIASLTGIFNVPCTPKDQDFIASLPIGTTITEKWLGSFNFTVKVQFGDLSSPGLSFHTESVDIVKICSIMPTEHIDFSCFRTAKDKSILSIRGDISFSINLFPKTLC